MTPQSFSPIILIPTYNNVESIADVIKDCMKHYKVIVINDGSIDGTEKKAELTGVEVLSYTKNCGKGVALQKGFAHAFALGYSHAIVLDGDGQHLAEDIVDMVEAAQSNPNNLVVGIRRFEENVPKSSQFGRSFSNFWIKVESGFAVADSQSGFRIYPLALLQGISFWGRRYEFEVEVMVKLFREGAGLSEVPISVYYPPPEERVSHFKAIPDNIRISMINTYLVFLRLIPSRKPSQNELNNPSWIDRFLAFMRTILYNNASPSKLFSSVFVGVIIGCTPFYGLQIMLTLFFAWLLKLNQAAALTAAHISIPPLAPFLVFFSLHCGSLCLKGEWASLSLDEFSISYAGGLFYQWLLGGLIIGTILGLILGTGTYFAALRLGDSRGQNDQN
ncbi:MAG: DUF2062 domain-containing protein [Planctomycetes bacterium]|nr:DUF2062 domain-containing protein [Planctomycetota bacterium]